MLIYVSFDYSNIALDFFNLIVFVVTILAYNLNNSFIHRLFTFISFEKIHELLDVLRDLNTH